MCLGRRHIVLLEVEREVHEEFQEEITIDNNSPRTEQFFKFMDNMMILLSQELENPNLENDAHAQ